MKYALGMSAMREKLSDFEWGDFFISLGLGALKIIFIYIVYLIIKGIGNRLIERAFTRYEKKENVSSGRAQTLLHLSKNIFGYVLLFIFIVTVLQVINIDVTAILAGAGIIGLAVGFGAQGLVSDVVTGFFLLLERQIDVGDYVTTGSFSGIVEQVGLRTTQMRGFDGTLHFVPNREITSVSNHSRGNMQALVDIGISYDDDIDNAIAILQNVCDQIATDDENIVEGPNVLGVQTLGASDVVLRIVAKTKNMEQWGVERKIRQTVKETFDANNIEIPYPHQVYIEKKTQ